MAAIPHWEASYTVYTITRTVARLLCFRKLKPTETCALNGGAEQPQLFLVWVKHEAGGSARALEQSSEMETYSWCLHLEPQ